MRSQRSARTLRVALFAVVLACVSACQTPAADAPSGQLADFASGVDAEFGVETFALTTPTLKITSPEPNKQFGTDFTVAGALKVPVCLYPSDANVGLNAGQNKIVCYLDGGTPLSTAKPVPANDPSGCAFNTFSVTFAAVPQKLGMHAIECTLADANGAPLTNATAHDVTHFFVTGDPLSVDPANKCGSDADCDDGNACSTTDKCQDFHCVYSYDAALTCCNNSLDCVAGEACLNPNTVTAKCSSCQNDSECNDNKKCTTDKCDLSGVKGTCANFKLDPTCCEDATDLCDDGKACTNDKCNVVTGKCEHDQPKGVCCQAQDCNNSDECLVASCVDLECRYGKDIFKPDCCSTITNALCDDKNPCTIDKCDQSQGATPNWTKCSHVSDPAKPKCCDIVGDTKCDDGNICTADVCEAFECKNIPIGECCVKDIDCDDQEWSTQDSCDAHAGKCMQAKGEPLCCTDNPD